MYDSNVRIVLVVLDNTETCILNTNIKPEMTIKIISGKLVTAIFSPTQNTDP